MNYLKDFTANKGHVGNAPHLNFAELSVPGGGAS